MVRLQLGSYRAVFEHEDFRTFWLGFTFSELGDMMTRVALTWYVLETTQSAVALGGLMFAYTGPVIIGGLVAGSILDRFDKRLVMMVDNIVRGGAIALIPLLHAAGLLSLWHVYVVAAVYGSLMMISLAGGPSLIPGLVPADKLATANALETLTFTLGGVVGPVLAGALIGVVGAPNVLIFDALSYAGFAIALATIRRRSYGTTTPHLETTASEGTPRQGGTLLDVAQFALSNKVILATTLMFAAFNLGQGMMNVWLPLFASAQPAGPALYGLLLAALSVGEVAGSLIAGSLEISMPLGSRICLSQMLAGLSLAIFLVGGTSWAAAISMALMGFFSAPLTIWAQTLRMQVIPAAFRGRAFALLRTMMQSTPPLGSALAGSLVALSGIAPIMAGTGLLVGLPGLLGFTIEQLRHAHSGSQDKAEAG